MSEIPEPPKDIQSIRDAAVDHALTGSALPERIEELYQWIYEDRFSIFCSFSLLMSAGNAFLHIGNFSYDRFSDLSFRAWGDSMTTSP